MEQKPRSCEEVLKIGEWGRGECSRQRAWGVQRARSWSGLDELEQQEGRGVEAWSSHPVNFKWEPLTEFNTSW